MRALASTAGLWVLGLLASACGGGGGDAGPPPPTEALWQGQHHFAGMQAHGAGLFLAEVTAAWGVAASDGAGGFGVVAATNADGFVVDPALVALGIELTYAVEPDRTLRLFRDAAEWMSGGLAADGALAFVAPAEDDAGPAVHFYGRREGAFDLTPLVGTWRLVAFFVNPAGPSRAAAFGRATFDATGAGSMTTTLNFEGNVVPAADTPFDYLVYPDGGILLYVDEDNVFEGGLVRGGDVVLLAGSRVEGEDPALFVLVREVPAPTVAGLAGTWSLASLAYDLAAPGHLGLSGRATTTAAGALSATLTSNLEGVRTVLPPVGGSWTVGGDGVVTLTLSGGTSLVGRAAPGGDFVALAGGTADLTSPIVMFLLR